MSIGLLDNSDELYVDGGGCTFHPEASGENLDQLIFASVPDRKVERGWINIDGDIILVLRVEEEVTQAGEVPKMGDKFKELYKLGNTSVFVECTITEVIDYTIKCDAEITVSRGLKKNKVKGWGVCGS